MELICIHSGKTKSGREQKEIDMKGQKYNRHEQTIGAISSRADGSAGVQYSLQILLSSSHRASAARHLIRP